MRKLHALFASGGGNVRTVCGKKGSGQPSSNEWTDRAGRRFQTVEDHYKSTCDRCKKSMNLSPEVSEGK